MTLRSERLAERLATNFAESLAATVATTLASTFPFAAALTLLAASGCVTAGTGLVAHQYAPPLFPVPTLGSMRNVSVREAVWTGSHPSPSDLELADRRGIAKAIDVSIPEEHPGFDVAAACEELGIEYVRVELRDDGAIPDDAAVDRALGELRGHEREPILLFSGTGDRAAMLLAVWRVLASGIDVDDAIDEARRAGMKPGAPVEFVRAQVARLSPGA